MKGPTKKRTSLGECKVEYQQFPDGLHVCIATKSGDWVADTGVEGDSTSEENAQHIVKCINACDGIDPEAVPKVLAAAKMFGMLW